MSHAWFLCSGEGGEEGEEACQGERDVCSGPGHRGLGPLVVGLLITYLDRPISQFWVVAVGPQWYLNGVARLLTTGSPGHQGVGPQYLLDL